MMSHSSSAAEFCLMGCRPIHNLIYTVKVGAMRQDGPLSTLCTYKQRVNKCSIRVLLRVINVCVAKFCWVVFHPRICPLLMVSCSKGMSAVELSAKVAFHLGSTIKLFICRITSGLLSIVWSLRIYNYTFHSAPPTKL